MKALFILVFILSITVMYAQNSLPLGGGINLICFNNEYDNLVLIDTNQVWYIVQPEKSILSYKGTDNPECGNSAIITDTNIYYSKNLNSYFQIAVWWTIPGDFTLRIQHKYDFQKNRDGGVIEISYDEGVTWKNIINDTIVADSSQIGRLSGLYTISDTVYSFNNQPAFTGTLSDLSEVIIPFRLRKLRQNYGTAIIRFRIASDSIDSNNEGWMIGTIFVYGWLQDAIKDNYSNPEIEIFLNLSNELNVYINNEKIKQLDIISIEGKLLLHTEKSNSINISNLQRGIYLLRINNLYSKKIFKN